MIKLQGLECREAFNNFDWDFYPVIPKESLNISAGTPYPKFSENLSENAAF